ncbi:MAG: benzoate-CoA ligase family protein, partial [Sulfobacillus sp.]|nr:benzoate-CoA ligase family protein [Sulfobacillus sp.]
YSSGSTGRPKAAVHCHRDMWVCNQSYARQILQVTEQDRLYSASKLYFAYGLGNGSYFALANGASVVLVPQKAEPVLVLDTLERSGATLFFGVPTLYNAMLQVSEDRRWDLSRVRAAVSAGEPLPAEIYTRFRERFGIEILDGIGSTEALHIYIANWPGQSRPGVTGRVVPGYSVKIVDEAGLPVPPGTIGDLYVKGDSLSPYYWNQPEKTRQSMVGEWFRTGDKFFQDDEGYLVYCGRSDDMIKVGGIWVSPIEVENVLIEHPTVLEAAVVAKVGPDGLARPIAYVVLAGEKTGSPEMADELQEFVKSRLAHYKYPREIHFVDALPKTASGKIQRFRLRQALEV